MNHKESGKFLSVIAYITIIGVLVAYFLNQDKKKKSDLTSFHVKQALGLWLLFFTIGYIVSGFSNITITYSLWVAFSVLFLYGIFGALSGKENKIPLLGHFFQNIFKSLG